MKYSVVAMLASLICGLSLPLAGTAGEIADSAEQIQPLRSGQPAPAFTVRDIDNGPYRFNPKALDRPVALITFRGGWCPYCNMHLSELRHAIPQLASMGFDVIFLSGDRPELLYSSLEADTLEDTADLDYRIFSDANIEAASAFGLAFRASEHTISGRRKKGQDIGGSSMLRHGVLPVPAVYLIDNSGMIRFDFIEANYKVRLPGDDLLAAARALSGKKDSK